MRSITKIILILIHLMKITGCGGLPVAEATRLSPPTVRKDIRRLGAKVTLARIMKDEASANVLYQGIASGEPAWLSLFRELKSNSGGAWSLSLLLALGEAIDRNPEGVLETIKENRDIGVDEEQVCSTIREDFQYEDATSKAHISSLALQKIRRRVESIGTVDQASLARVKEACAKALDSASIQWNLKNNN